MALNFIAPVDSVTSIILKDAYFGVQIFPPHRKYLRFMWRDQRYELTCLPFSYSLAPRRFTKNSKPFEARLRLNGLRKVIFLDDILLAGRSYQECLNQLALLRKLLN